MSWLDRLRRRRPPAPPPLSPAPPDGDLPTQLLAAVNGRRRALGLPPLAEAPALASAAGAHASDVASGRARPHDGFVTRLHAAGYSDGREVAAQGQRTPTECADDWLASPGHRAAILGPWRVAGGGAAPWPGGGWSWVMLLA